MVRVYSPSIGDEHGIFTSSILFPNEIFLRVVEQEQEYMNQNWGMNFVKIMEKAVENLTGGGESPLTL